MFVADTDERLPVRVWLPPEYHGRCNEAGEPYNSYAFTHADRVRISPIEGCSMTCKFCDLPYEFPAIARSGSRDWSTQLPRQ